MKVKVIKPIPGYAYFGGETIDLPTEKGRDLITKGYLEAIPEEGPKKKDSTEGPKK